MEPSAATEELVANIKLGVLERAPADRAASAANDEFAVRMVRGTALQPVAPMLAIGQRIGQDAAGAAALCDAWRRRGSQPSGAGVLAASRRLSRPLPGMERGRSSPRRRRASRLGHGAAILHRDHRLPGGRRNQHRDGAAGRHHGNLRLERKLPARPRQLVRNAAADHPPYRDLVERAVVDRAADAAGGRARRVARPA